MTQENHTGPSRRTVTAALGLSALAPVAHAAPRALEIIAAPCNLGLRPLTPGREPGTWRAPEALRAAGLETRLRPAHVTRLARPPYSFDAMPGSRIRNGPTLRAYSQTVADAVAAALDRNAFPLVVGGDCSLMLGGLLGARRRGPTGLVHVDGHADFFHPGNYDPAARLGSVAGMDLALATGRGEATLANWGPRLTPLVADRDAVQIGERGTKDANYPFHDMAKTAIRQFTIETIQAEGVEKVAAQALAAVSPRRLWLHVDLDVLDQKVMPAVDSPGTPGLDFDQLARLIRTLRASGRIVGANVVIFDPELDPKGDYARGIVDCLATALA
jgi:arginase